MTKQLFFDIEFHCIDDIIYKKKNFLIDSSLNEDEIAEKYLKALYELKKIEYGKDFKKMIVNSVMCRTIENKVFNKDKTLWG